jgi:hypothetical protein
MQFDGGAYPCNATNHLQAQVVRVLIRLQHLDSCPDLEGRTRIRAQGELGTEVLDVVQVLRPQGEGARADAFAIEVVALILDAQTQVEAAGKIEGELDLGHIGHIDDVRRHAAERAGVIRGVQSWGEAGQTLVKGPIDPGGLRGPFVLWGER